MADMAGNATWRDATWRDCDMAGLRHGDLATWRVSDMAGFVDLGNLARGYGNEFDDMTELTDVAGFTNLGKNIDTAEHGRALT